MPSDMRSDDERSRHRRAYEDARLRGLCDDGAREVAAEAARAGARHPMAHLQVKRVYDDPSGDDGTRVLIDRLWPRGVSKEDAQVDLWCKELAPSDELRRWYDHDPERFDRFAGKYREELKDASDAIERLRESIDLRRRVTLLTATKDLEHGHAGVLRAHLADRL